MPPPEKNIPYLVERPRVIRHFEAELERPGLLQVGDMEGAYGVGKTTALVLLYHWLAERRERGELHLAWIDMSRFEPPPEPEGDDPERRLGWRGEVQEIYKRFLATVGKELLTSDDEGRALEDAIDRAYDEPVAQMLERFKIDLRLQGSNIRIGPFARVENSRLTTGQVSARVDLPIAERTAAFSRAHAAASRVLAERVSTLARETRVVIFLDNFCYLMGSLLERWLLELICTLDGAKVVLGRTDYQHSLDPVKEQIRKLPIDPFDRDESDAYVRHELGDNEGWGDVVYGYCLGNPLFTAILVDILKRRRSHGEIASAADLGADDFTHSLPDNDRQRVARLADELVHGMSRQEPLLSRAIDVSCVLGEVEAPALAFILGGITAEQAGELYEALGRFPFIERRRDYLLVHWLFADERARWLRQRRPEEVKGGHLKAADFYGRKLHLEEADTRQRSPWQRWHRYEMEDWQQVLRRWLFHLAADPDSGLELALRYFDAFFWWADFVPFVFTERLLADLERAELPTRGRRWVEMLGDFHRSFPPLRARPEKPAWAPRARGILRRMIGRAGLRPNRLGRDPERHHLKAMLHTYLGDAYDAEGELAKALRAYDRATGGFSRAAELYREAAAQAEGEAQARLVDAAESERWCRAWIVLFQARMQTKQGRHDEATVTVREAEEEILETDEEDLEALALVHFIRGEIAMGQGETSAAIDDYARYALFAAGFLIDEYGTGGDLYTLEFMRQCIERIADRWVDLEQRDPPAAVAWWRSLKHFFAPAGNALVDDLPEDPPPFLDHALRLDDRRQVLAHQLPLPRLPIDVNGAGEAGGPRAIELDDDYRQRTVEAFEELRDHHGL